MASSSPATSGARVKYKIVKCTSEDPEYPVSELLAHSSQTKGWQTARFCEFPQEIGLQFESPVHLRQVQFLSHQSKIATKIELFTALPGDGANCKYESAQFKRLGYLSLDSNERSQFQARELKSVYVDVSAQFLRIVLHKCHTNRYNIVNQVGLIALHCSGEAISPDLAVGPPVQNPTYSRKGLPDNAQAPSQPQRPAASPVAAADPGPPEHMAQAAPEPRAQAAPEPRLQKQQPVQPPPVQPPAQPPTPVAAAPTPVAAPPAPAEVAVAEPVQSMQVSTEDKRYDARTTERIRELTAAKAAAVENEDYEEAKRCKQMIDRLKETGEQLRELEERKRSAVQNEDYDAATSLKSEIDRLRSSAERPLQKVDSRDRVNTRSSHAEHASDWAPPPQQMTAPRGGHQPVMAQGVYDSNGVNGGGSRAGSQGRLGASPESSPHGAQIDPTFGMDGGTGSRGGSSPKFNPVYDEPTSLGPGPPMPFDDSVNGSSRGGSGGGIPSRGHLAADESSGFGGGGDSGFDRGVGGGGGMPSEAAYHLRGVPNVEDIMASPEPLSVALEKDKECMLLLQLFGDYITRCIYSKTWNLRDAAMQKLAMDLREGVRAGDEPNQLLQGYAATLKRTIADKNVQVSLSSGGLLQAVAQVLLQSGRIRRNEVQSTLDSIMPLLADRLGEANARVDKTARDALLNFARCQHVGAAFTAQYLLKSPKKKSGAAVHARVYSSRLQVLTALASDFGVQPECREGVPLESAVKLAMECFTHKEGDVRENSVKLVAACYMHVGLRRIEGYLSNLRPAQREVFDAEFERVSGAPGSQGRMQPSRGAPRVDDAYSDTYSAPPRSGSAGGRAATNAGYCQPVNQEGINYDDQEVEEFTCQFCGRQDPSFTPDALDVHYWRECPMLIQCEFCQQVVEICQLRSHLLEECESGAPAQARGRDMFPHQCPLCRANVGQGEEADWREHLLFAGCPRNPRGVQR